MKFYEYINKTLKVYGCRKAFGVPGGQVKPIWQNLKDIEIILCSHEQEASYVASGYSRAAGELVAVITIGSPGVTNCASGIASANMDSVPMLYISGQPPVAVKGLGQLQEESKINRSFDSVDLLAPLTKCEMEIADISSAAQQFSEACELATSGRKGCVHLSIPVDIQAMELPAGDEMITAKKTGKKTITPKIPKITKPLIIIGWGSWQAGIGQQIYQFAEKIGAPVLVTSKAYSCIWGDHPNYLGKLGYGYNPILEKFLQDYRAEQVLVFGSSMARKNVSESCLNILQQAEMYLYSVECDDVKSRVPNGRWIKVGDLALMINSWLKKIKSSNTLSYNLQSVRQQQRVYCTEKIEDKDLMARAIMELNTLCDDSCVITADAGNNLLDGAILYEPKKLGGMFLDVGIRAMGSGPCLSTGMALASKNKYQIAITGDGSMLLNGNVMCTAKRNNLPVLFLVTNNSAHGRVRIGQMEQKSFIGTTLGNIDFTLYGKTFGLDTYRASTIEEFRSSMIKILSEKKTALLELCTDQDEIPPSLKRAKLF